jgi:hypothetical protein
MGRKRSDAPPDAPPPGAGGNDYRKRSGKVGITVNVTLEERDALRIAAAVAGFGSMSSYLVAAGLKMAAEGQKPTEQPKPTPSAAAEEPASKSRKGKK